MIKKRHLSFATKTEFLEKFRPKIVHEKSIMTEVGINTIHLGVKITENSKRENCFENKHRKKRIKQRQ